MSELAGAGAFWRVGVSAPFLSNNSAERLSWEMPVPRAGIATILGQVFPAELRS
jgi:hypothetical protein